jgi:hypothetical protein
MGFERGRFTSDDAFVRRPYAAILGRRYQFKVPCHLQLAPDRSNRCYVPTTTAMKPRHDSQDDGQ